ncbi:MAG: hypothetical protein HGA86_07640 [Anaerolineaceae bacterium]|nr:hypothetical protein [Anaerolineaceae bacterium]
MRKIFLVACILLILFVSGCSPKPERNYVDVIKMDSANCDSRLFRWFARSGQEMKLEFSNSGSGTFDWIMLRQNIQEPFDPSDLLDVWFTTSAEPGTTKTTSFQVPLAPGEFQILCGPSGSIDGKVVNVLTITNLPEDTP